MADLYSIRDLRLSLPDMTKKPLLGAAPRIEILKGLTFSIPKGEILGIVGGSGSGKSTLLRCCNMLEESQDGDIEFEGEAVRWKGHGQNRHPADKAQSAEVLKFFDWAFKNGKQMALELDYVPLPDALTAQIRSRVWSQIAK